MKKALPENNLNNYFFNFQFYNFEFHKSKKKDIDILFYYRNHQNKFSNNIIKILKKLKNKKFKILVVGDKLDGFENIGIIKRANLLEYLKRTKYTFLSIENTYSFFSLDAISCHVKIIDIYNKQEQKCALTNELLTYYMGPNLTQNNYEKKFNITIDKIDEEIDYYRNNIRLIGKSIYKMKSHLSHQEFLHLCQLVSSHDKIEEI